MTQKNKQREDVPPFCNTIYTRMIYDLDYDYENSYINGCFSSFTSYVIFTDPKKLYEEICSYQNVLLKVEIFGGKNYLKKEADEGYN